MGCFQVEVVWVTVNSLDLYCSDIPNVLSAHKLYRECKFVWYRFGNDDEDAEDLSEAEHITFRGHSCLESAATASITLLPCPRSAHIPPYN